MKANIVIFSLVATSLIAGCSASKSYHVSEDYKSQALKTKKIGVVIAQAEILNLGAGGQTWPNIEKSAQSKEFFQSAAVMEFNRKGYSAVLLTIDDDLHALIKQYNNIRPFIHNLYSINSISGNPMARSNRRDFDTIPNLESAIPLSTRADVDAIVIIWALSHISTSGREALSVTLSVVGFFLGGGGGLDHGKTYGDLALFDKSGKLLFYNLKKGNNLNLTEEINVSTLCSVLVNNLVATQQ